MKIPDLTEPVPQPGLSPGQVLAERREEWGLTVQDVASNLNLGAETIEALEADNYERLPGSTFVKGYIRSYARLLKLDAEDLLENIDLQPERITEIPSSRAVLKSKGKTMPREKKKSGGGFFRWVLIILVLGILLALALTQLPRLGVERIEDLFPMSGDDTGQAPGNPVQDLLQEGQPADTGQGGENASQGALIRIE
jgi:cytoskeleton protein RodZ